MKLYEWMVKYTPQKEWIERRGILMWLAEVGGAVGGGLYLVALYFGSFWGMLAGCLIVIALKGGFHLAYLGKPLRFWRILLRPGTSWLSRGFIFMGLFILFGVIQLAISYWLPGITAEVVFKVLAGIMAFLTVIYAGFAFNYVHGIEFWNSALLPVLFITTAILDGFGLTLAIALTGENIDIMAIENGSRLLLIICALLLIIYLWSATYTGTGSKYSVMELTRGNIALIFWIGTVACGIIIPIVISLLSYFSNQVFASLLITAIACETIGAFALKYCVLKAGIYKPLVPSISY
jgi:formate-dependent nitrite reductase membrane component NrfD